MIRLRDPSPPCLQSASYYRQWCNEVGGFSLHPGMTDPHHSCLVSSDTLTARCLPRGIRKQFTQKMHEKTIAVLQLTNMFSLYISLAVTLRSPVMYICAIKDGLGSVEVAYPLRKPKDTVTTARKIGGDHSKNDNCSGGPMHRPAARITGSKLFVKSGKGYQISMTIPAKTSPEKPKQLEIIPLKSVGTPAVQTKFVFLKPFTLFPQENITFSFGRRGEGSFVGLPRESTMIFFSQVLDLLSKR
ncbi:hypothetical protein TNCV_898891 [Trichonephila clavipes]|nr:hypothetical protein TNCV_898891 [Trichonephila clavipes]